MNAPALEMKSVLKLFDTKLVLHKLNFVVPEGRIVGLLGRNGAGKSTLIECALGLQTIAAGSINLLGDASTALSEATRGRIGYVPQENDLFEWMTATQMLGFFKAFYPRWNDAKVEALLDRWSIPRKTLINSLSVGEKQRLSIIRSLAHVPDLLILDEPVASLDPAGRREFLRELVDTTLERNTTILFSTHILTDLERVAVDVAMMKDGKILLQAELDSLSEQAVRLSGPSASIEALEARWITSPVANAKTGRSTGVTLLAPDKLVQFSQTHSDVVIDHLSLEDLFIEVTT